MTLKFEELASLVEQDYDNLDSQEVLADYLVEQGNPHGEALAFDICLKKGKLKGKEKREAQEFLVQEKKRIIDKYGSRNGGIDQWMGAFPVRVRGLNDFFWSDENSIDQLMDDKDGRFAKLVVLLDLDRKNDFKNILQKYESRIIQLNLYSVSQEDIISIEESKALNLKCLNICDSYLNSNNALIDLLTANAVKNLRVFGFNNTNINDTSLMLLGCSYRLQQLKELRLTDNDLIGDEGFMALTTWTNLKGLETLRLNGSQITDRGAEVLLGERSFPKLERLALYDCPRISSECYASLLERAKIRNVELEI